MDKRLMAKLKFALFVLAELAGILYIFFNTEKLNLAFNSDYGYLFAAIVLMTVCTSFEMRLLDEIKRV